MDTLKQMMQLVHKYKYVAAVVLAGLALMLLPGKEEKPTATAVPESRQEVSMEESLESILSKMQGVGRVEVLLTQSQGSRTIFVRDESTSSDSMKTDAVILTDASRAQKGLVSQVIPPVYLGAIVVCQGGASPEVRLAVVEAVCDATGLSADKISVLKMK
jgi:stage III sporulation protein AG